MWPKVALNQLFLFNLQRMTLDSLCPQTPHGVLSIGSLRLGDIQGGRWWFLHVCPRPSPKIRWSCFPWETIHNEITAFRVKHERVSRGPRDTPTLSFLTRAPSFPNFPCSIFERQNRPYYEPYVHMAQLSSGTDADILIGKYHAEGVLYENVGPLEHRSENVNWIDHFIYLNCVKIILDVGPVACLRRRDLVPAGLLGALRCMLSNLEI